MYQEEILNRKMVIALNKVDTDREGDLVSRIKHEVSNVSEGECFGYKNTK